MKKSTQYVIYVGVGFALLTGLIGLVVSLAIYFQLVHPVDAGESVNESPSALAPTVRVVTATPGSSTLPADGDGAQPAPGNFESMASYEAGTQTELAEIATILISTGAKTLQVFVSLNSHMQIDAAERGTDSRVLTAVRSNLPEKPIVGNLNLEIDLNALKEERWLINADLALTTLGKTEFITLHQEDDLLMRQSQAGEWVEETLSQDSATLPLGGYEVPIDTNGNAVNLSEVVTAVLTPLSHSVVTSIEAPLEECRSVESLFNAAVDGASVRLSMVSIPVFEGACYIQITITPVPEGGEHVPENVDVLIQSNQIIPFNHLEYSGAVELVWGLSAQSRFQLVPSETH